MIKMSGERSKNKICMEWKHWIAEGKRSMVESVWCEGPTETRIMTNAPELGLTVEPPLLQVHTAIMQSGSIGEKNGGVSSRDSEQGSWLVFTLLFGRCGCPD